MNITRYRNTGRLVLNTPLDALIRTPESAVIMPRKFRSREHTQKSSGGAVEPADNGLRIECAVEYASLGLLLGAP